MTSLVTRIHESRFCIMPLDVDLVEENENEDAAETQSENSKIAKLDADAMSKATVLIGHGWKMDDWLDGPNGWVVSRWIDISSTRRSVVHSHPSSSLKAHPSSSLKAHPSSLKAHSNCPLCYEKFDEQDIVVNLPCNHNFHVNCHCDSPGHPGSPDRPIPSTSYENNSIKSGLCAWLSTGHVTCPCCRAHIRAKPKC
jgi:hypothetical protein